MGRASLHVVRRLSFTLYAGERRRVSNNRREQAQSTRRKTAEARAESFGALVKATGPASLAGAFGFSLSVLLPRLSAKLAGRV